jgi:NAD(P)-dependent dehydrogenase (short-subunit alcohol dehydrogenase family)
MQRQKRGVIIFTSSAGGHSNIGMGSYTMGKLGMIRLAEILHHENFKDYNIKAFAYNPGRVHTRFFTDFLDKHRGNSKAGSYVIDGVAGEEKSAETVVNAFKGVSWDTPQMAAGLVTALASGKLDFMSGRYLDASRDIEKYIEEEKDVRTKDLHRVRLRVADDWFIPTLDF